MILLIGLLYHTNIQVQRRDFLAAVFLIHYYFKNLGYISDRSNSTDSNSIRGSELPQFSDVKIFVDSLLMEYQTDRRIQYELERNLMTCTPYRTDYLFSKMQFKKSYP